MQNRPWPWIITIYAVLLVFVGCSTSEVKPPPPAPLVSLSVAPVNSSIAPGTTVQFTATGTFADNTKRNVTASVTWNSSDPGIADVSNTPGSQGLATATMTIGPTVISAISDGITGTTTLTTSHVNSITVTPTSPPCIAPGTSQQYAAKGTLVDGAEQNLTSFTTWTSSDLGIANVSNASGSKGLATAGATVGIATIEASYDGATGSASFTSSAVASIATTPASATIPKGTTQQFTAIGTLSGGCNIQDVTSLATWTTSNTAVATVSNIAGSKGLATAVDVGAAAATISATLDSVPFSSATLSVTAPVLESIAVTPANPSIALGQTQPFTATGTFSDGTTLNLTSSVTWNSSNTGIATISNISGLATSHAEGTATITATVSGITSNSATLTVTSPVLVSITIAPSNPTIIAGLTKQFFATGTFSDGTTQDLTSIATWDSSNSNTVAFISNAPGSQGLVTSKSAGVTVITATFETISGTTVLTVTFF